MRHFTAIFIHCGAIFSTWDLFQGFSSTVSTQFTQLSGHQKWDFLKGFQPQCTPGMRKKNSLENFQLLWSWNEAILEDFHPQSSLNPNNPKKLCMYKGQNSNFEWVTATVNTLGMGIWTAQLFVYIFLFVYIWVSCLFTFQVFTLLFSFGWTFQL